MMNPYCLIYGTRPEIIKLAPIIYELSQGALPFFCVHTGQQRERDDSFFEELELPPPRYRLELGPLPAARTAEHLLPLLSKERPAAVIVQGEDEPALAGAMAARRLKLTLAHVEAGLRGPGEAKSQITGLADIHFAPTAEAGFALSLEQAEPVFFVGNTVVDMVLKRAGDKITREILAMFELLPRGYLLLAIHKRAEEAEAVWVKDLALSLGDTFQLPLVMSVHPKVRKHLSPPEPAEAPSQLRYTEFLALEKHALCVLTDRESSEEECAVLGTPALILRKTTRRPVLLDIGAAVLCGLDEQKILAEITALKNGRPRRWTQPFGDGQASRRIVDILETMKKSPPNRGGPGQRLHKDVKGGTMNKE